MKTKTTSNQNISSKCYFASGKIRLSVHFRSGQSPPFVFYIRLVFYNVVITLINEITALFRGRRFSMTNGTRNNSLIKKILNRKIFSLKIKTRRFVRQVLLVNKTFKRVVFIRKIRRVFAYLRTRVNVFETNRLIFRVNVEFSKTSTICRTLVYAGDIRISRGNT